MGPHLDQASELLDKQLCENQLLDFLISGRSHFSTWCRYDNGIFWAFSWDAYAFLVVGFDVTTLAPTYVLNASTWENGASLQLIWAIFANPRTGGLLVIGNAGGDSALAFYSVVNPTSASPTVSYLGNLPCTDCSDFAWDAMGEVLYAISNEESQTGSGQLLAVSTKDSTPPVLVANITLQVREHGGEVEMRKSARL